MLIDSTITKIDFLKRLGCEECLHGSDTLLHHLIGTHDLLKQWGAEEYVQDAGLYHSVYGTEYFQPNLNVTRDQVREIIGTEAERLVDLFCCCQPPRAFTITLMSSGKTKEDLLLIERANDEEIGGSRMMTMEEAYDL